MGSVWPLIVKVWGRMGMLAYDVEVLKVSKHLFLPQGILGDEVILWEPILAPILSSIWVDKVEVVSEMVEFWVM